MGENTFSMEMLPSWLQREKTIGVHLVHIYVDLIHNIMTPCGKWEYTNFLNKIIFFSDKARAYQIDNRHPN